MWRLGPAYDPLGFKPRHLYRWTNRFDDADREYRTLYAAYERITCLREILQDFRPNTKAVAEFRSLFPTAAQPPAGLVGPEWRDRHVLIEADAVTTGPIVDLRRVRERARLEREHAALLAASGMEHLDLSDITSRRRPVTQRIGRSLYDRGAAGVRFPSNPGDGTCLALFEGRGRLDAAAPPQPLGEDDPDLLQVCGEFNLALA